MSLREILGRERESKREREAVEVRYYEATSTIRNLENSLREHQAVAPRRLLAPKAEAALKQWHTEYFRTIILATEPSVDNHLSSARGLVIDDYEACAEAGRNRLPLDETGEQNT